MPDLSVFKKRSLLDVLSIKALPTISPLTLDIKGSAGFLGVSEVVINSSESPKVTVLSDTRLLAQVPEDDPRVEEVSVFSSVMSGAGVLSIVPFMGRRTSSVVGVDKVIQKVIKVLFTGKGTDAANTDLGGSLNRVASTAFSSHGELSAEVSASVNNVQEQIIKLEGGSTLPPEERLDSIKVLGITRLNRSGIELSIEVTNQAGDTGNTAVTL